MYSNQAKYSILEQKRLCICALKRPPDCQEQCIWLPTTMYIKCTIYFYVFPWVTFCLASIWSIKTESTNVILWRYQPVYCRKSEQASLASTVSHLFEVVLNFSCETRSIRMLSFSVLGTTLNNHFHRFKRPLAYSTTHHIFVSNLLSFASTVVIQPSQNIYPTPANHRCNPPQIMIRTLQITNLTFSNHRSIPL